MKFRKWQIVRCLDNSGRETDLTVGDCYPVADVREDAVLTVTDNFVEDWFTDKRFELVIQKEVGTGMTKEEYLKFHEEFCAEMVRITKAKNHDYTGTNPDPFANFRGVENGGICSTEQGFLVRMHDKMARISSFVQQGVLAVKDESIEDTLKDLANYSALLAGYIKSKKQEASK